MVTKICQLHRSTGTIQLPPRMRSSQTLRAWCHDQTTRILLSVFGLALTPAPWVWLDLTLAGVHYSQNTLLPATKQIPVWKNITQIWTLLFSPTCVGKSLGQKTRQTLQTLAQKDRFIHCIRRILKMSCRGLKFVSCTQQESMEKLTFLQRCDHQASCVHVTPLL